MSDETKITKFPLTADSAKQIVRELAYEHSAKVVLGSHSRERMKERGISRRQIIDVLRNKYSTVTERPCQTPRGSWKFNILGVASGTRIEVVIDLKEADVDDKATKAFVVTVILR